MTAIGEGKLPSIYYKFVRSRDVRECAQTMPEYVVILGVITLAIVTSLALLSGSIQNLLSQVAGLLP
jgi:Flp pilus assembly pilin Flp